jgi:hypothetical protein
LAIGCVVALALVEFGLRRYLNEGGANTYPEMMRPLQSLPTKFSVEGSTDSEEQAWDGVDHPGLPALAGKLPYHADDLLFRIYRREPNGPQAELYMVYSRLGDDRKHHPEICIRDVAGAPEDREGRKLIALDKENQRLVQRFRFLIGGARAPVTVYYWHYTLAPLQQTGRSWLQNLYRELRQMPPSMTVQVSTRSAPAEQEAIEREFLVEIDNVIRSTYLPADARIGYERLPIALQRE